MRTSPSSRSSTSRPTWCRSWPNSSRSSASRAEDGRGRGCAVVHARPGDPVRGEDALVKDEAPVIRRCLESVRPLIDRWVILDTGSTDGTQDVIREVLGDLPGVLHESPFRSFDKSRSEAIDLARADADYLLFIDADDLMEVEPGFRMPELTEDAYRVALHDGRWGEAPPAPHRKAAGGGPRARGGPWCWRPGPGGGPPGGRC
ncbi:glycosyltransferase [Streptomyces sp. NPDC054840]